jgi:hypothetical protein
LESNQRLVVYELLEPGHYPGEWRGATAALTMAMAHRRTACCRLSRPDGEHESAWELLGQYQSRTNTLSQPSAAAISVALYRTGTLSGDRSRRYVCCHLLLSPNSKRLSILYPLRISSHQFFHHVEKRPLAGHVGSILDISSFIASVAWRQKRK